MMLSAKEVLRLEGEPVMATLIEAGRDARSPRSLYVLGISLPDELVEFAKARIRGEAERIGKLLGMSDEDIAADVDGVLDEMRPEGCVTEPFDLCWN